MKILYYDCFAGISGDMHLGALLDLGVAPEDLKAGLAALGLEGYTLEISRQRRNGITGTQVVVHLTADDPQPHRGLKVIEECITASCLSSQVKQRSLEMFRRLAQAEARVHGTTPDRIHFHEVGALDAIVDIVGAAICIEALGVDRIMCSVVQLGSGYVHCAHGKLPVPAPATVELLQGMPVSSGAVPFEATTPTGATILATNVHQFSSRLDFTITKIGYGVGQRESELPNLLRVYLGETHQATRPPANDLQTQTSCLIECNIDDMTPEMHAYVMEELLAQGAADVFLVPIIMKKSRPAISIKVLCQPQEVSQFMDTLFRCTSTLGVRVYQVEKNSLRRAFSTVSTPYGTVRVKQAYYDGRCIKSKPEFEDCRRLAKLHQVSLQQIYEAVSQASPGTSSSS